MLMLRSGCVLFAAWLASACGGKVLVEGHGSAGQAGALSSSGGAFSGSGGAAGLGAGGTSGIASGGAAGAAGSSGGLSPLHTDGRWFKDANGDIVTLRGVALADLAEVDTLRAPMNVAKVISLVSDSSRGWYARVVRLTVFPSDYLMDPKSYVSAHLLPAIRVAAEHGLYAIVDWHEIDDPNLKAMETIGFWAEVAPQIAGFDNVLLEVYNEVQSTDTSWETWQNYAQEFVNVIRKSSKQIVLVGGPNWDQLIGDAVSVPVLGDNIAYVGHIYPQIDASVWGPNGDITRVAQSLPLMITEWGYDQDGDIPTNGTQATFGDPFKKYVNGLAVGWIAWCADTQWGPAMFDANWQPQTGNGKMGAFAQAWLAEYK